MIDILKPWPVCAMEKLPGGWGIMADDLLGGLFANVILQALNGYFHHAGWVYELLGGLL
ncbi:MAG: phosphatidylglycerophosphatase A [Synergistaceae bacterium]|nr:phosphatidylglycerophosphatase A [Synergistaceae bacterium]